MNPNSNETNGIQLPPPVPEQAPATGDLPEVTPGEAAIETPTGVGETSPATNNLGAVAPPLPMVPLPPLGSAPGSPAATLPVSTNAVLPDVADDTDLIEKEWVNKAKQIIEKTRQDPHEQSKEVTVLKADYMQKRYNKVIKLSE